MTLISLLIVLLIGADDVHDNDDNNDANDDDLCQVDGVRFHRKCRLKPTLVSVVVILIARSFYSSYNSSRVLS